MAILSSGASLCRVHNTLLGKKSPTVPISSSFTYPLNNTSSFFRSLQRDQTSGSANSQQKCTTLSFHERHGIYRIARLRDDVLTNAETRTSSVSLIHNCNSSALLGTSANRVGHLA